MLINKRNLAIAVHASKEENRYTLQGIEVSDNGTTVTDEQLLNIAVTQALLDKICAAIGK